MKIDFTVTKCTVNKAGSHVLTLNNVEEVTLFGQIKKVKRTYYLGGMPTAVPVNTVISEDTANFRIQRYPVARVVTARDAAGEPTDYQIMDVEAAIHAKLDHEVLELSWLHAKNSVDKNL